MFIHIHFRAAIFSTDDTRNFNNRFISDRMQLEMFQEGFLNRAAIRTQLTSVFFSLVSLTIMAQVSFN